MNPGSYKAIAKSFGFGYTQTGTEQIGVTFELTSENVGETITWYGFFSDKAIERTIQSLRNCGWTGSDLTRLTMADLNVEVVLVIIEEEYNGQVRKKVAWVNSAESGIRTPMSDVQLRGLASRVRGKCMMHLGQDRLIRQPSQKNPVQLESRVLEAVGRANEDRDDSPIRHQMPKNPVQQKSSKVDDNYDYDDCPL